MGKNIKIYGHSDDCIEVEGDIKDEGYVSSDNVGFVELNTGDVFKVEYTNEGVWRISRIQEGNPAVDIKLVSCEHDEQNESESGYSDIMYIHGEISHVDFWKEWPVRDRSRLQDLIETYDDNIRYCSVEQLKQILKILKSPEKLTRTRK